MLSTDSPKCPKCGNKGTYLVVSVKARSLQPQQEKVICDCNIGRKFSELDNQKRHPEYQNPFHGLSDQECLDLINRTVEREMQWAKNRQSEFNL